jgi:hypothetical protein
VINVKIPGAFADELYVLRLHLHFVRNRLVGEQTGAPPPVAAGVMDTK